jgi:ribonuclease-3
VLWTLKPNLYINASRIEASVAYEFSRKEILWESLTHRSALVGVAGVTADVLAMKPWNERLEFLGDSVLGLVISEALLNSSEGLSEGEMSRVRAAIVCEDNLVRIARTIHLGEALVLGGSEIATDGQNKSSILADALEALLGAVYKDGGWEAARQVTQSLFAAELTGDPRRFLDGDPKTKLQEIIQAKFKTTPTYDVVGETGPSHKKYFEVAVKIDGNILAQGHGASKKDAAQAAARRALSQFVGVAQ